MSFFKFAVNGLEKLSKQVNEFEAKARKAQLNAIKTEAFSLRATMKQAILMGTPAPGVRLRELSMIARTVRRKSGVRAHLPLRKLAGSVTYDVEPGGQAVRVGFTRRSPYWARRAAEAQQAGFSRPVTFEMRQHFRAVGHQRLFGRLMRGEKMENQHWTKRVLFLRSRTTRLVTPPRPIVDPFWKSEQDKSVLRIRRNFRMIMKGQVAPGGNLYTDSEMAKWQD